MRSTLRMMVTLALGALALGMGSGAEAVTLMEDARDGASFRLTGYAQPYLRWVQNPCSYSRQSPGSCTETTVPDGFGMTRARVIFQGTQRRGVSYHVELRTIPNVELLDLRLMFDMLDTPTQHMKLTVGRFRVPFSRQELTSESRLQLISRASFISNTPGRQLGAMLAWASGLGVLPKRFLEISLGVYNGESAKERAPINNIDEEFLYAGRVQVSPFGAPAQFAEGDVRPVGGRAKPIVSFGANYTYEVRGRLNGDFKRQRVGADALMAWHGVFLYAEGYRYDQDFKNRGDSLDPDRHGVGWNLQGGFFVPVRYLEEHLELAGRVESWDPEDARNSVYDVDLYSPTPGAGPASLGSTQAHRGYVAGLNWYFEGHDLKLQANYTHRVSIEPWQLSHSVDGVPQEVDDDTFFLQMTYRL